MLFFFFFNDPATTEIYTLSLHDALPIYPDSADGRHDVGGIPDEEEPRPEPLRHAARLNRQHRDLLPVRQGGDRSEEHTSELQSQSNLVCRLLLEKKKRHEHHRVGDMSCH